MAGPYGGGTGGPYGSSRSRRSAPRPNILSRLVPDIIERPATAAIRLPVGLTGNLFGDVKDAVIGLPMGLAALARDPAGAGTQIAKGMWHTWSPLFRGDIGGFARGVYDHPLAPILDVAAVFTLGAGSAARVAGGLTKAGVGGTGTARVAALRAGGVREIVDPLGKGAAMEKQLSYRAGRRLVQNGMAALEGKGLMPQWYANARYNRMRLTEMSHRSGTKEFISAEATKRGHEIEQALQEGNLSYLAARFQTEAMLRGAEALEDITAVGRRARSTVVGHMHSNLIRHNRAYRPDEAKRLMDGGHWRPIKAPEYMDPKYTAQLLRKERQHARAARQHSGRSVREEAEIKRLEEIRQETSELANSVKRIEDELHTAGDELQQLRNTGYRVSHPAQAERTGRIIDNPRGRQQMTHETRTLDDATRRVRELEELRSQSLKAKARHEDALGRLEHLRKRREDRQFNILRLDDELTTLRNRAAEDYYNWAGDTYAQFQSEVDNFGRRALTSDTRLALKDDRGWIYMAPKHDAYNLAYEGGGSLRTLHTVIHRPTMLWKRAVLLYTPRIIANNAVGNWFLYMVRNADANGVRGFTHTMMERYGKQMAREPLFPTNHWLYRWFSDEMGADTFARGNLLLSDTGKIQERLGQLAGRAGREGFYGIQYELAEKPVRAAAIRRALMDVPEIRARMKELQKQGMNGRNALGRAVDDILPDRPDLRDRAALESRRLAGDYISLSETEKFARDIIPFYLWQRHILKTMGNMLIDQPGRVAIGARLSELGIKETQELIGEVPEYLRGALPLAALGFGDKVGRANILLTSSLNPFATVGEMAEGMEAFLTGGRRRGALFTGAGINPFLTGTMESVFQKSLLTDTNVIREGGVGADVISRILLQLPHLRALDSLTGEQGRVAPSGTEYTLAQDRRRAISWLSGFTIGDMSKARAAALAAKERGETITRRRGPYG